MHKTFFLFSILSLAVLEPARAGIVVSVNPAESQIGMGESVGIAIDISGLETGSALAGYDLAIGFDPALLRFDNAVFGDPVLGDQLDLGKSGLNFPSQLAENGLVSLIEFSFDDSSVLLDRQAKNFALATLFFTGISAGDSPLNLSVNSLSDTEANFLAADARNGSLAVTAVPLPGALGLFAGGLAMLWPIRRQAGLTKN